MIEALMVRLKCTNKNMQKQYCVLDNLTIPQLVTFYARVWLLHAHKSTLVWVDKDGVVMKHYPNLWKNVWLFLSDCPIFSLVFPPCPPLSLKFFRKRYLGPADTGIWKLFQMFEDSFYLSLFINLFKVNYFMFFLQTFPFFHLNHR